MRLLLLVVASWSVVLSADGDAKATPRPSAAKAVKEAPKAEPVKEAPPTTPLAAATPPTLRPSKAVKVAPAPEPAPAPVPAASATPRPAPKPAAATPQPAPKPAAATPRPAPKPAGAATPPAPVPAGAATPRPTPRPRAKRTPAPTTAVGASNAAVRSRPAACDETQVAFCSGRGDCADHICRCAKGWRGPTCNVSVCTQVETCKGCVNANTMTAPAGGKRRPGGPGGPGAGAGRFVGGGRRAMQPGGRGMQPSHRSLQQVFSSIPGSCAWISGACVNVKTRPASLSKAELAATCAAGFVAPVMAAPIASSAKDFATRADDHRQAPAKTADAHTKGPSKGSSTDKDTHSKDKDDTPRAEKGKKVPSAWLADTILLSSVALTAVVVYVRRRQRCAPAAPGGMLEDKEPLMSDEFEQTSPAAQRFAI
ncbi:hypothetical protein M885DRAFT_610137 [Pelagophyceae sp. CCMP2097]|nr:hypothetical protein M885DRAFT_610137 [Pelagophyceae sp. CCMP2097]